jgi:hypothetical protein
MFPFEFHVHVPFSPTVPLTINKSNILSSLFFRCPSPPDDLNRESPTKGKKIVWRSPTYTVILTPFFQQTEIFSVTNSYFKWVLVHSHIIRSVHRTTVTIHQSGTFRVLVDLIFLKSKDRNKPVCLWTVYCVTTRWSSRRHTCSGETEWCVFQWPIRSRQPLLDRLGGVVVLGRS